MSRSEFNATIDACCEALKMNKIPLYEMFSKGNECLDINFRFRFDEVVSMNIYTSYNIYLIKKEDKNDS